MRTKILLLSTILFSIAASSNAQLTKGKVLLGGSISYANSSDGGSNSFYSNVQAGKFVKDNTVFGVGISYSTYKYEVANTNPATYGLNIFYRKYKPIIKDLYFFAEVSGGYSYSRVYYGIYRPGSDGYRNVSNGGSINLTPGISYSLWKHLQVELIMQNLAYVNYSSIKTIYTTSGPLAATPAKQNIFNAGVNLNSNFVGNLGIGFKFLLGK